MRRHLPLGIALAALTISLLANPSITQAVAAKIKGSQISDNSIAAKKLKPAVRAKLNKVGAAGPQGMPGPAGPQGLPGDPATIDGVAAGGVLDGSYPDPTFDSTAVAPDASKLGGAAAAEYQQKCQTGTLKAAVSISLGNVSTTNYSTLGLSNPYMCIGGTIFAKRVSTGTVNIAFHPTNQSGQFGAFIGNYPMVNATATGAGYMANVSGAGNPGDPPPTYSSILTYRVRVVDHADVDVDQSVRVVVF
jgi:hypothetical protein